MWKLADPIAKCSDHICSKCWLLEDLWLRVDELELEPQTLRHIREGEKYLDTVFQETVTPGRLRTSNSVSDQGQQGVTVSEAGRGILQSGTGEPWLLTLSNTYEVLAPCVDEEKVCREDKPTDHCTMAWEAIQGGGAKCQVVVVGVSVIRRIESILLEDTNNMPVIDDKETKVGEDLETIIIMKEIVLGKLMELKVDKSPGPDGMYPRLLKEMAGEIVNALA
eukprot:g37247.t1